MTRVFDKSKKLSDIDVEIILVIKMSNRFCLLMALQMYMEYRYFPYLIFLFSPFFFSSANVVMKNVGMMATSTSQSQQKHIFLLPWAVFQLGFFGGSEIASNFGFPSFFSHIICVLCWNIGRFISHVLHERPLMIIIMVLQMVAEKILVSVISILFLSSVFTTHLP